MLFYHIQTLLSLPFEPQAKHGENRATRTFFLENILMKNVKREQNSREKINHYDRQLTSISSMSGAFCIPFPSFVMALFIVRQLFSCSVMNLINFQLVWKLFNCTGCMFLCSLQLAKLQLMKSNNTWDALTWRLIFWRFTSLPTSRVNNSTVQVPHDDELFCFHIKLWRFVVCTILLFAQRQFSNQLSRHTFSLSTPN